MATVDQMGVRTLVNPAAREVISIRRSVRSAAVILIAAVAVFYALMFGVAHAGSQEASNAVNEIIPANGAALTAAPESIQLGFDQAVGDDERLIVTLNCNAQTIALGDPEFGDDSLRATVPIMSSVPRGNCLLDYALADAAGTIITEGATTFSVDADPVASATETTGTVASDTATTPAATTVDEPASSSSPNGFFVWLTRLVSTITIMITFGSLVVIGTSWPEGPEYVITLNFMRLVWTASLIFTFAYLVTIAAANAGTGIGGGLNPLAWIDLLGSGWTGFGAVVRFAAVGGSAYVALRPERIIDPAAAMWAWLIPGVAVISLAFTSVSGSAALIGLVLGVVYSVTAASWFGGTVLVNRVVLVGAGDHDLVHAVRNFSKISRLAIVITVVTAFINMFRLVGGGLFSTWFGRIVLLEVIVFAALIFVAFSIRQQVDLRLAGEPDLSPSNASRFRRAFGAEAAIGIVVLALSGALLSVNPAGSVPWSGEEYTREIEYAMTDIGLDAVVKIGPGQVGKNGFLIQVSEPPEGITELNLRFIPPAGTKNGEAVVIDYPIPLTGAGSAWRSQEVGIPFGVAGTWRLELSATTAKGVEPGGVRTFLVNNADGTTPATSLPTQTPTSSAEVEVQVVDPETVESNG